MSSILIFNGKRLDEFGLRVSGGGTYDAPKRIVESVAVPNRNGAILNDTGTFANISVKYDGSIVRDFSRNSEALREWLMSSSGYCRLEDSYHPDEFRLAAFYGDIKFTTTFQNRVGSVSLAFDAMPQRFLKSGDKWIELSPGTTVNIKNPTMFASDPLIEIDCPSGQDCSFSYGETTVFINALQNSHTIVIDALNRNARLADGETESWVNDSLNNHVTITGDMKIQTGNCIISSINCTSRIKMRWWKV